MPGVRPLSSRRRKPKGWGPDCARGIGRVSREGRGQVPRVVLAVAPDDSCALRVLSAVRRGLISVRPLLFTGRNISLWLASNSEWRNLQAVTIK